MESTASIEELLRDVAEGERKPLLVVLIASDAERRRQSNQTVDWDNYASRFPEELDAVSQARELWESDKLRESLRAWNDTRRESDGHVTPAIPVTSAIPDEPTESSLTQIGRYEVRDVIGSGGMGIVYRAFHPELKRDVAVKTIRGGQTAPDEARRRFHAEATVIARIQHPAVVQIYDVGHDKDTPYFVMELIAGGTLGEKLAANTMSPKEAAAMLLKITKGLEALHTRGIVHRDLKPGNILLTEDGEPKITDFGLAKQLEDPSHTQTGQLLGTPHYMAPEQAAGEQQQVGPATDVYALGAILYEMLTQRPPFRGASTYEVIRQVREEPPSLPSSEATSIPADLDTICLKCLEKDPQRRYPDASTLREELERFVNGRPIQARPVPWIERAYRQARRFPVASSLAVALVIGLTAGLIIVGMLLKTAREQQAAALAEEQRSRYFLGLTIRTIEDVVEQMAEHPAFVPEGRLAPVRRDVLRRARDLYEEVVEYEPNDRQLRQQLAVAASSYADIIRELESPERALPQYQRALKRWELLLDEQADAAAQVGAARASYLLANMKVQLAAKDADASLDQAERLARAIQDIDADELARASRVTAGIPERDQLLALDVMALKGMHLSNNLKMDEARVVLLKVREALRKYPRSIYRFQSEVECLRSLAVIAAKRDQHDEARDHWQDALSVMQDHPQSLRMAELRSDFADHLEMMGDNETARENLTAAADVYRAYCDQHPFDLDARKTQVKTLAKLGTVHLQSASDAIWQDQPYDVELGKKGLGYLDQAIALQRDLIAAQPTFSKLKRDLARLVYARALACKTMDQPEEARQSLVEARDLIQQSLKHANMARSEMRMYRAVLVNVFGELGQLAGMQGKFPEAETHLERGYELAEQVLEDSPDATARSEIIALWLDLAHARLELGKYRSAIQLLDRMVTACDAFPEDHPYAERVAFYRREALTWLPDAYQAVGDLDGELQSRQRLLPYEEGEDRATQQVTIGSILIAQGRIREGLDQLQQLDADVRLADDAQWGVLTALASAVAASSKDRELHDEALSFYRTTLRRELKKGRWTQEGLDRKLQELPDEIQRAVAGHR